MSEKIGKCCHSPSATPRNRAAAFMRKIGKQRKKFPPSTFFFIILFFHSDIIISMACGSDGGERETRRRSETETVCSPDSPAVRETLLALHLSPADVKSRRPSLVVFRVIECARAPWI